MANSKIAIANIALGLISEPEIQDFNNPKTKNERVLKSLFDEVFTEVCSEFPWNFCTKSVQLAESSETPIGYSNSFIVPTVPKTLRVLKLENVGATDPNWERQGYNILVNSAECFVKLVYLVDDMTLVPPHVVRAISTLLASRIAVPILGVEGQSLASYYQQLYTNEVRPNAQYLDANEGKAQHNEESSVMGGYWIDGHFMNDAYGGQIDFIDVSGV